MIKIQHLLLAVFPYIGFSQTYKIPEIPFEASMDQQNLYVDLFGLKDTNVLIVHIGRSRHPLIQLESDYIVYLSNGEVQRHKVFWRNNNISIQKKTRTRVKKSEYKKYWDFLTKCVTEGRLNIDQGQLETIGEKANALEQAISGGYTYQLGFYQGKKQLEFFSFSPGMFTSEEYPGHEEKQQFVEVMTGFQNLFE